MLIVVALDGLCRIAYENVSTSFSHEQREFFFFLIHFVTFSGNKRKFVGILCLINEEKKIIQVLEKIIIFPFNRVVKALIDQPQLRF